MTFRAVCVGLAVRGRRLAGSRRRVVRDLRDGYEARGGGSDGSARGRPGSSVHLSPGAVERAYGDLRISAIFSPNARKSPGLDGAAARLTFASDGGADGSLGMPTSWVFGL